MASDVSPANEVYIQQALVTGKFASRSELLDAAVSCLREEEATLAELRAALASAAQGEGMTLAEADEQLRARFEIPRRS